MKQMRRPVLLMGVCLLMVGQALAGAVQANVPCSYKAHSHIVKSTMHWHWIVPTTHETVRMHEHTSDPGCTDKVLPGEYNSHRFGFPEPLDPIPDETQEF